MARPSQRDIRPQRNGKYPLSRELYAEGARLYREQNDLLAYAHAIRHIADIYQQESRSAEAKPLYEEALKLYRSNLNTKLLDLANAVRPYALLLEEQSDIELVQGLWEEARHLYSSLRIDAAVAECESHIARL